MKVASVQINPLLGDFYHNVKLLLSFIKKASDCDLIVCPELALFGYWPGALLERPSVVKKQLKALQSLHQRIPPKVAVLVGAVTESKKKYGKYYHNSAVLLIKDQKPKFFHKTILPTYDVFDEARYFEPGHLAKNCFRIKGYKVLVTICEDTWASDQYAWIGSRFPKDPLKLIKKGSVDLVVNLSASPFSINKAQRRLDMIQHVAKQLSAPMLYTNLVGGQDEIIFDGGSVLVDQKGSIQIQSKYFEEDLRCYDLKLKKEIASSSVKVTKPRKTLLSVKQAIVLGIKDFVKKAGYQHVHLGLSGGIDSAIVACLAVEALGPRSVTVIALPGPFSTHLSYRLAQKLAKNLNCHFLEFSIQDAYKQVTKDLKAQRIPCSGIISENIQSRLRCLYLMAFANHKKSLLLSTSNKSEYAVGYTTLYGDMSGALAPIGDLLKTRVYKLAKQCYKTEIPSKIISRPPTAELKKNQKDTDHLLPYHQMDPRIKHLMVKCGPAHGAIDRWILEKMRISEFKKWQSPPVLRVTEHAFGSGRRCPINHCVDF